VAMIFVLLIAYRRPSPLVRSSMSTGSPVPTPTVHTTSSATTGRKPRTGRI